MKRTLFVLFASVLTICMSATVINVPNGSKQIYSAANEAAAGDTLMLSNGEYTESSTISLSKQLTIMAKAGTSPVLKMSARFQTTAPLTLKGLYMQGSTTEAVRLVPAGNGTLASLRLQDCTLEGFTSKFIRVYNTDQTAPYVDSISIDNCLFRVEGSVRALEATKAELQLKHFKLTRSTFDGGKGTGRFIYLSSTEGTTIESAIIDHCTFYNSTDSRAVYLANIDGAMVSNSILMNAEEVEGRKGFCLYGAKSSITHCVVLNAPVYGSPGSTTNVAIRNPLFINAAAGDFRLYANSPAVGKASDGTNIGDPRWTVTSDIYDNSSEPYIPYKKPYSMAPTVNSVKVLWQMQDEDKPTEAVVRYGTDRNNLDKQVTTSDGWYAEGEGSVHVVTLTGLQPFTRYFFTVGDSKRQYADTCSTKTAPEQGTAYRIFSISDIHGNARNNWSNMQDFICGLNPDIALMNGDFVSSKGNDRNWNSYYFTPGAQFLAQVPVMSSPGNHETGDPFTYRWSSFYDYFHQFSHEGKSEGDTIDPRGEAYFHFVYGNADVVVLNINGDPSSPDFMPGSRQYQWADSILNECDRPWIIICHHVGVHTTGYHGQWADEPRQMGTLFEKYAAKGKRIISLSGDDHSFEHLYKDGVHYVRPGCGRDSNYPQQKQLNDFNYSMFYRQISCFSTFDMSADAKSIALTAYDSVGNIFYNYTFLHDGEVITPAVHFIFTEKETEDSVKLQWSIFDPAKDAQVALYYAKDGNLKSTEGMTLIAGGFDKQTNKYIWHTRDISPKGQYYIYATITSGGKTYLSAPFAITLLEDITPPPAPTAMRGNITNGHYCLTWKNPTHLVHLTTPLEDFTDGIGKMQNGSDDGAKMTMKAENGCLQADYSLSKSWATASADYVFSSPVDARQTPFLSFKLKGNGTSTSLRLVSKNNSSGHEDWWYTEAYNLASKDWKTIELDMRKLSAFEWYANSDNINHCEGLTSISFGISDGSAISGTFYLDDIEISGDIFPAPDFLETIIVRKENGFSASVSDGIEVYRGKAEEFTDTQADISKTYYYAAFASDDRGNISAADVSAQWCTNNPSSSLGKTTDDISPANKKIEGGQLFIILPDGRCFNAVGQVITQ